MFRRCIVNIFIFLMIFVCCIFPSYKEANAFFTQNYKKNNLQGVFKKDLKSSLYFNVSTGFVIKTWTPSLINTALFNNTVKNNLLLKENATAISSINNNFTYSLTLGFGYNPNNSGIRHEFQVEWYDVLSKTKDIGNEQMIATNEAGARVNVNATKLDDNYYTNIGYFATNVRLTYNFFYNFQNLFKFISVYWDIYLGAGVGLSIINLGLYSSGKITSTTSADGTTTTNMLTEADIKNSISTARDNNIIRSTVFAVAYHVNAGFLANISQSFALNIGINFGATSRPLLSSNFKGISGITNGHAHLEYHISLQIGLLLKVLSI